MVVSLIAQSAAGSGWTLEAVEEYPGWSFIVRDSNGNSKDVCISGTDAVKLAHLILAARHYPPFDAVLRCVSCGCARSPDVERCSCICHVIAKNNGMAPL